MSAKLAKKLAEVMAAVHRIPKRGRNDFHKYDYATEADISEALRKELAERSVVLIPAILHAEREPVGDKGSVLTTLTMEFTFIDGESGETITRSWLGAGTDKEDKGAYKAMTGGEKYFLLKTFLLPTGDDPEADDSPKKPKAAAAVVKVETQGPPTVATAAVPEGALTIKKTEQLETTAGKQYWQIVFTTGETLMTWKPQAGAFAEQACQNGTPVRVQVRGAYQDMGVIQSMTPAVQTAESVLSEIADVFNKTVPPAERGF